MYLYIRKLLVCLTLFDFDCLTFFLVCNLITFLGLCLHKKKVFYNNWLVAKPSGLIPTCHSLKVHNLLLSNPKKWNVNALQHFLPPQSMDDILRTLLFDVMIYDVCVWKPNEHDLYNVLCAYCFYMNEELCV